MTRMVTLPEIVRIARLLSPDAADRVEAGRASYAVELVWNLHRGSRQAGPRVHRAALDDRGLRPPRDAQSRRNLLAALLNTDPQFEALADGIHRCVVRLKAHRKRTKAMDKLRAAWAVAPDRPRRIYRRWQPRAPKPWSAQDRELAEARDAGAQHAVIAKARTRRAFCAGGAT